MSSFLITGARAPVVLELVRNLSAYGHQVFLADSLKHSFSRYSRHVAGFCYTAAPRTDLPTFCKLLCDYIDQHHIDYLVPTCEEALYISYLKPELAKHCTVICEDFVLMKKLHSKIEVLELAKSCVIGIPETQVIDSQSDLTSMDLSNKIVKKEFTRFGVDVDVEPTQEKLRLLIKSGQGRFLLQQKISGQEFCTYSVAWKGQLLLHSCYKPVYRIHRAASFYFQAVEHSVIQRFIREFVKQYNYTGQIGFDFIDDGQHAFLIECNPRATSGLHLCYQQDIAASLTGHNRTIQGIKQGSAMVGLPMFTQALLPSILHGRIGQWFRDFRQGRDVVWKSGDLKVLWGIVISLLELSFKVIRSRKSLRRISTRDIEWDGDGLD